MTAPAAIISAIENALSDTGLHLSTIPLPSSTLHALLKARPHED